MAKIKDMPCTGIETSDKQGNYVIVMGVIPTAYDKCKSITILSLIEALFGHLGRNSFTCMR